MKCEVDKLQGIFRNQKDKEEALEELNTLFWHRCHSSNG